MKILNILRAKLGLMDTGYTRHLEEELFNKRQEIEKWIAISKELDNKLKERSKEKSYFMRVGTDMSRGILSYNPERTKQ